MRANFSNGNGWWLAVVASLGCSGGEGTGAGGSPEGGGGGASVTSGASSVTSTTSGDAVGGAGGGGLEKPSELVSYVTGNPADAEVAPAGPGLILMGGGPDVDAAFEWWVGIVSGGDVVVLRTSGADGYNDYLYEQIGGCDSVETMLVTSTALANSDYVADALARAEGIFLAGGDQFEYLEAWRGTRVEDELMGAWSRGAVVGGTSAGCAVLGDFAFSAAEGTVYSDEALADPYNPYMTFEQEFLDFPPMARVVTDTHFFERDRMGRLVAFVARPIADGWATSVLGLGIDEGTALLVDADGQGTVVGGGHVYALASAGAPQSCSPGAPLFYADLPLRRLAAGETIQLPSGVSAAPSSPVSAANGVTVPSDPY